jgi:hypothetical protein
MSLWRKNQNAFSGKERLGPVACSETFRWTSRRLDHPCSGDDGVLRADRQFVQTIPGRLLGADALPGVMTTAPQVFAWWGEGTACESSAAFPAPTA